MTIEGVVVERNFCVEHAQLPIGHDDQRIYFQHRHVFVDEGGVEPRDEVLDLLGEIACGAERARRRAAVMRHDSGRRIDGERMDLIGRMARHVLDVDAALGRNHERHPARLAVDQRRQIELLVDVRPVLDVEAVDLLAGRAGLRRDQSRAQHLPCEGFDFLDRTGEPDAALFARRRLLEPALAAPAGMNLALDHPQRSAELLGRLDRSLGREGRKAVGDRRAECPEHRLRLIFMDIHRNDNLERERLPALERPLDGNVRRARN